MLETEKDPKKPNPKPTPQPPDPKPRRKPDFITDEKPKGVNNGKHK